MCPRSPYKQDPLCTCMWRFQMAPYMSDVARRRPARPTVRSCMFARRCPNTVLHFPGRSPTFPPRHPNRRFLRQRLTHPKRPFRRQRLCHPFRRCRCHPLARHRRLSYRQHSSWRRCQHCHLKCRPRLGRRPGLECPLDQHHPREDPTDRAGRPPRQRHRHCPFHSRHGWCRRPPRRCCPRQLRRQRLARWKCPLCLFRSSAPNRNNPPRSRRLETTPVELCQAFQLENLWQPRCQTG